MSLILRDKFTGSLLGGMLGDIIGAVVEAESPGYIRKAFQNIDAILALEAVEELFGGKWIVGKYTDDTQMTLCVAEWLIEESLLEGKPLLARFSKAYEPWRRYGPGAGMILETFSKHPDRWSELATMMFPQGSYGNGSAMRAGPIGLRFHNDLKSLVGAARISSITTHAHPWGIQGAVWQATAVAIAARSQRPFDAKPFLASLGAALDQCETLGYDSSPYRKALHVMSQGLAAKISPLKVCETLGVGIKAHEAVPTAIYCFLSNPGSYEATVNQAVFLGGDTDTIASMAGAISGAFLGVQAIPPRWLQRVREKEFTPEHVTKMAYALCEKGFQNQFRRQIIPR